MKSRIAKLVTVTFTTRVVVSDGASDEEIFSKAIPMLKQKAK